MMGSLEDLFVRIENAQRTDRQDILDWLSDDGRKNKDSYRNVSNILAEPFQLRKRARQAKTLRTLKQIEEEVKLMEVFDPTTWEIVQDRKQEIEVEIQERKINESIARAEEFARKKKIKLSEKIIGREENWKRIGRHKGGKVLVLRENGKFKSWKKI